MDIVVCVRIGIDVVTMDDGVGIFLLTVVRNFEGGDVTSFEMYVFVVVVVLEVRELFLGLEFTVELTVEVTSG